MFANAHMDTQTDTRQGLTHAHTLSHAYTQAQRRQELTCTNVLAALSIEESFDFLLFLGGFALAGVSNLWVQQVSSINLHE